MSDAFLGLGPDEIVARLQPIATAAGAGVVRVGDEVHGYRNVGVSLPPGRRSAEESRRLRDRISAALEGARVVMAECAIAPRVEGSLRGSVRVREVAPSRGADAAGLYPERR